MLSEKRKKLADYLPLSKNVQRSLADQSAGHKNALNAACSRNNCAPKQSGGGAKITMCEAERGYFGVVSGQDGSDKNGRRAERASRIWHALLGGLVIMSVVSSATADQHPRGVVALDCPATRPLCQSLVQALSEIAPIHIYRINPEPRPEKAFVVALDFNQADHVRLRWQDGGAGAVVAMADAADTDLVAHLIASSPGLGSALRAFGTSPSE